MHLVLYYLSSMDTALLETIMLYNKNNSNCFYGGSMT